MLRISVLTLNRWDKKALQAFAGRLVVAHEEALHVRIAQNNSTQRGCDVRLDPRRPQELVVWADVETTRAPSPR